MEIISSQPLFAALPLSHGLPSANSAGDGKSYLQEPERQALPGASGESLRPGFWKSAFSHR